MKRIVWTVVMVIGLTTAVSAGTTCSQVGDYTYCTDYSTGQTTTCYRVGQYTYCN